MPYAPYRWLPRDPWASPSATRFGAVDHARCGALGPEGHRADVKVAFGDLRAAHSGSRLNPDATSIAEL